VGAVRHRVAGVVIPYRVRGNYIICESADCILDRPGTFSFEIQGVLFVVYTESEPEKRYRRPL
jgi:hypothetical protein